MTHTRNHNETYLPKCFAMSVVRILTDTLISVMFVVACMSDKVQPGGRIDPDVWERFKKFVEQKHGRTRGVVGRELENALENHMKGSNPTEPIHRIEDDVATMKAQIARIQDAVTVESDGGSSVIPDSAADPAPTPSNDASHTHTDDTFDRLEAGHPTTDDVPNAKAPKSEKAAYVFASLDVDGIVLHPNVLRTKIDKTWSFGERATDDLVERIFERYHAKAVQKEGDGDRWQVALGKSIEDREDAIDDWEQDEPVYVAEQDGREAEGADVFDVVN